MEMCYNGTLVMPKNYTVFNSNEMEYVEGGISEGYYRKQAQKAGKGNFSDADSDKLAISYTLGYLSAATWWCAPLSLGLGIAGTLYGCN